MGANGASGQELQIAPKNRFRANFFGYGTNLLFSTVYFL
jgi:hypothetical protein